MPNPLTIEDLIVLVDNGENAFTILGETVRVLQMSDHSEEEIKAYVREATSSDYEHLIPMPRGSGVHVQAAVDSGKRMSEFRSQSQPHNCLTASGSAPNCWR